MIILYITLLLLNLNTFSNIDENIISSSPLAIKEELQTDNQQPSMANKLDSLKFERMIKREGIIVIKPNTFWTNMLFAVIGVMGIFLKIAIQLVKSRKKKISDLIQYISNDSLVVFVSLCCYAIIIIIWWTQGLELLGFFQGTLNASTFFVGLGAERILATAMKEKNIEIDQIPVDDDKEDEKN